MLNELRRQKQITKDDQPRKRRSDKKVDIRVLFLTKIVNLFFGMQEVKDNQ
ncbi:hypothetical protein KHA80_14550 [Anaerobacillus sp. HL2]|nr:hypothetical protein KHA80_14550 [Anaerobacillus sp. HL2]